jgi:TPP-dependent pyruvate/acetoin dehydrogenase alpha subunit
MGRSTGVCGGRGGSQHLHWRNFYTNGVLGSTIPIATGAALAEKYKESSSAAIAFLGDGALGEGVVYEAFNLASLWSAPILFVIENNHIAQTTPVALGLAGEMIPRLSAFGITAHELDTSDVQEVTSIAEELLAEVRRKKVPRGLILHTHRFGPHSKGDDTRPAELLSEIRRQRDPVKIQGARLDTSERARIAAEVDQEINQAFRQALADPPAK